MQSASQLGWHYACIFWLSRSSSIKKGIIFKFSIVHIICVCAWFWNWKKKKSPVQQNIPNVYDLLFAVLLNAPSSCVLQMCMRTNFYSIEFNCTNIYFFTWYHLCSPRFSLCFSRALYFIWANQDQYKNHKAQFEATIWKKKWTYRNYCIHITRWRSYT